MKYYLLKYQGTIWKTTSEKIRKEAMKRGAKDAGYIEGWNISTSIPNIGDLMRAYK